MPKQSNKERIYAISNRELELRKKCDRLQSMIDVLVHDKNILEAQYFNLKENFYVLANLKIRQLADCMFNDSSTV